MNRNGRGRSRRSVGLLGAAVLLAVAAGGPVTGASATGSAGTDTSLPRTDSAVTVKGRGPFTDLEITVNQTRNLLNQAVSLTWTGGRRTSSVGGPFGGNYLQVMQCWGDDDGTNAANPGPPPEKCAFGATNSVYGGVAGSPFPAGFATERIISRKDWPSFDPALGTFVERTGHVWRDFLAVGGTRVGNHYDLDFNPTLGGGVYWQNSFFNIVTTNEIAGARTLANGTGADFFEVATGIENGGLGCGQQVEAVAGGAKRVPKCWLVIVPRGDPEVENAGSVSGPDAGIVTSPLAPAQWQHRIAVPLDFNPVETACRLGADNRRLVGNEMVSGAIASWQPVLCATPGLRPYSYGIVSDSGARQQLVTKATGSAGMYVVSAPLEQGLLTPDDPTVYAPLTLSGIAIGFNIERLPSPSAGLEAQLLAGVRIATINLTPRLVAKLLTQSYARQVNIQIPPGYPWLASNPDHMGEDEDFLRFNPEFKELSIISRKQFSGLLLPAGNSDAAAQLWRYVLDDPEAKAWLDGTADEWGMRVNSVYATTPAANSQGVAFATDPPSSYPKSDPYCYQAPKTPRGVVPPLLCGTDWNPYTQSLRDAARLARASDDGTRLEANAFAASADRYYSRTPPQPAGARTNLALTDTASASLFGLQAARLSRAGDAGAARRFIAPDVAGLTAGIQGMAARSEVAVLEPDPKADAPGGYPLTTVTYGAIRPLGLGADERSDYAAFVEYAAGPGQVSGPRYGQLPVGFAPLPAAMQTQAKLAAKTIRELEPPPEDQPTEAATEAAPPDAPREQATAGAAPVPAAAASASPVARRARAAAAARAEDPALMAGAPLLPDGAEQSPIAKRGTTPGVAVPLTRLVLPALAVLALLSALGALEVTKRPRRGQPGGAAPDAPGTAGGLA